MLVSVKEACQTLVRGVCCVFSGTVCVRYNGRFFHFSVGRKTQLGGNTTGTRAQQLRQNAAAREACAGPREVKKEQTTVRYSVQWERRENKDCVRRYTQKKRRRGGDSPAKGGEARTKARGAKKAPGRARRTQKKRMVNTIPGAWHERKAANKVGDQKLFDDWWVRNLHLPNQPTHEQ